MPRKDLKMFRLLKGLTQDEMAVKIGYSRNQYQRVENGEFNPTLRFLVGMSKAFGMSLDTAEELTKLEEEQKENDR